MFIMGASKKRYKKRVKNYKERASLDGTTTNKKVWRKEMWAKFKSLMWPLSQIGTVIAAVAAVWAIHESITQRESMYQPNLLIETYDFLYISIPYENYNSIYCTTFSDETDSTDNSPFITIHNVGFGAALNVQAVLNIDTTSVLKTVKSLFKDEMIDNYVFKHNDELYHILFDTFKESYFYINYNGQKDIIIFNYTMAKSYVMPIKETLSEIKLYLNPFIFGPFEEICKLAYSNKSDKDNGFDYNAYIDLSYHDINNKKYKKRIPIRISVHPENEYIIEFRVRLQNESDQNSFR